MSIIQAFDGDKFICMDSYVPENCLIYSFGIRSKNPNLARKLIKNILHPNFVGPSVPASFKLWEFICLLCLLIDVLSVIFPFIFAHSKQWEFEDVMDQLKCKVVNILENVISDGCNTVVL